MADYQLKNIFFHEAFIKEFSEIFEGIHPSFDKKAFAKQVLDKDWEARELKERMRHITLMLHNHLPKNFKKAASILKKLVTHLLKEKPLKGSLSFEYMFLPDYIEIFGQEDIDSSINAIEKITQYSSAEFAVRPFIKNHPKKMMAQMQKWTNHKNKWVRRLATEGCRPRLPWGMALGDLKKDPTLVVQILEKLKNDSAETVRRSVANNLNDISKDHPKLALELGKKWIGKETDVDWIVKHGLRTLLKQGNVDAMLLFGFADPANIVISELKMEPQQIKIGDGGEFSFQLNINSKKKKVKLRLEYFIYFMKANGKLSKKIFQLKEKIYPGGLQEAFKKKQHFKNLTTRKHYAGTHKLSIVVNGVEKAISEFELIN